MALGRRVVLRRLRPDDRLARAVAVGGLTVDWVLVVVSLTAVFLAAYLVVALLKPEWFS